MNADTFLQNFGHLADAPGGIDQLRTFVLQLAFDGKLPTDSGNTAKRDWTRCSINDIAAEVMPGFACSKKHEDPNGHVHLRTHNVGKDGRLNFDLIVRISPDKVDQRKSAIRAGDVIFNNTNSQELVGKTCIVDNDYDYGFSNHLTIVRFNEDIDPSFVVRYFNLLLRNGFFSRICNRWIGQAGINTKAMKTLDIEFPPLSQQQAIVSHIDTLFALCDELEARQQERRAVHVHLNDAALNRLTSAENDPDFETAWTRVRSNFDLLYSVPKNVNALRQAIIDLGSQGRLGTQDSNDVAAEEMLSQNRQRHRVRWEELELAKQSRNGKRPKSEKWKSKYREPDPPDTSELPLIPEGWSWERIELLGADPLNTVQTGPFGSQLLKDEFVEAGVPVIAVGNLTGTGFTTDNLYFITPQKAQQLDRYDVKVGDVLFARSGATLGKVCVAPTFVDDWRMTGHILRARLNTSVILPDLLVLFLWGASIVNAQVRTGIRGMTRPGYNTSLLERIIIPIPPLAEQHRIVQRVQDLMALCDDLEAKLTQQQTDSDRLTEAMVASMLEGSAA